MKQDFPATSIKTLCRLFGYSRHALYDRQNRLKKAAINDDIILQQIKLIRKETPKIGTRKLHHMIAPLLLKHNISIGRDYLFNLLGRHKMLIRQRKRKAITTDSKHWLRKYSNLVAGVIPLRPEQIWVSDITYIRMKSKWGYLSLITDAYSRKIMGHSFRKDLSAQGCIDALSSALLARQYPHEPLIHHSDRGVQYCCNEYVALLHDNQIVISMTENSDPYENAVAERVNGIIKEEFNLHSSLLSFEKTKVLITKAIKAYNERRPHSSCDYLVPSQAHFCKGLLKKHWKKYPYKKPTKTTENITV